MKTTWIKQAKTDLDLHPDFASLLKLAHFLRSDQGCPWDRKQTLASTAKDVSEEATEIQAAVENKDNANLQEEIGDVLFTLAQLIAQAEAQNLFAASAVMDGVLTKMISRHTWVFGDDKASTEDEALRQWNKNKQMEQKS